MIMNSTKYHVYNCPSIWPLDMPWSYLIIWAVTSSVLSPITIISNVVLIYGLYKTQQLTTITNKLILLMNICDLGTGFFVMPLTTVMICMKNSIRNCTFELFLEYIAYLFGYFSFFMLMFISLDRYFHVIKLNKYHQFMNNFRMKLIIVASFIISASLAWLLTMFPTFLLQLAINLSDLVGISVMFFLYLLVFYKVAAHGEKLKHTLKRQRTGQSSSKEMKQELSAMKTIRFVLCALLVLYLPYNVSTAIWSYYKWNANLKPPLALDIAVSWSFIFLSSNAAINAVIIGYGNSIIRRFLMRKFHLAKSSVDAAIE